MEISREIPSQIGYSKIGISVEIPYTVSTSGCL